MDIKQLLNDKAINTIEKRNILIKAFVSDELDLNLIKRECETLNDKQVATILEAIEEITNKNIKQLDFKYIYFVNNYISSDNNSCKREASRIIGNISKLYPSKIDKSIKPLLDNTENESTVVRWASAYALSRIIELKEYASTNLFDKLKYICDKEQDNGLKNQYLKSFKKAVKIIDINTKNNIL